MARTNVATVYKLRRQWKRDTDHRHIDVRVGEPEIKILKQLCEYDGIDETARAIGITRVTLMMVMVGWFDRCNSNTKQAVRAFFATTK